MVLLIRRKYVIDPAYNELYYNNWGFWMEMEMEGQLYTMMVFP